MNRPLMTRGLMPGPPVPGALSHPIALTAYPDEGRDR